MEPKKRIKCCGKLTMLYKRDRVQYCPRCHNEYSFEGRNLGFFGRGKTETEVHEEWQKNEEV